MACRRKVNYCKKKKRSCSRRKSRSSCGRRKRSRSSCSRRRKRSSCSRKSSCRPGKITPNPFFNFLRVFRQKHCSWPVTKIAVEGARIWCRMSKCEKKKYRELACSAPRYKYKKRCKAKRKRRRCRK